MEFMIGSNFLDYVFESPNQLIIQIIVQSCPFESVKLMASVFKENILMYQNLIWYKIQYNHNGDTLIPFIIAVNTEKTGLKDLRESLKMHQL